MLVCFYGLVSAVHSPIHEHLCLRPFVQKLPTVNTMAPRGKDRRVKREGTVISIAEKLEIINKLRPIHT